MYNTWKDGFADASDGTNIQGIMNLSWSKEREEKYFNYTQAYNYSANYLIVRKNNTKIKSLNDLKNKTIYLKEKSITDKIVKNISNIKVIYLKTDNDMYKELSQHKKVDAFISSNANNKDLEKYNFKVAKTLYDKTGEVSIGVNKKYPLLASIIDKIYKVIPKEKLEKIRDKKYGDRKKELVTPEIKSPKISFLGIMSFEEILFAIFIAVSIASISYLFYKKSNILNIKLKTFNMIIIAFELSIISFLIFEIIKLDRTEHSLAKMNQDKLSMIEVADKLRQSSDDLTHFVRIYIITNKKKFKQRYLDTLAIRNGKKARPKGYGEIYWDLDKQTREKRHPFEKKIALRKMFELLPFSKNEIAKLKESEDNSNDLVNLEVRAFKAMENKNQKLAIKLVHSDKYYEAKQKIMLPIDEMLDMLHNRTNMEVTILNEKIHHQFTVTNHPIQP